MYKFNPHTPLWQLTVGEFIEIQKHIHFVSANQKYEYGIKGLAKILGCSKTKATEIKKSGVLNNAIYQNGRTIIIDKEKVMEYLKINKLE